MDHQIGIIYSSVDGQTKKICEKLQKLLQQNGIQAKLFSIDNFSEEITDFQSIIIGASIRYGKHNPKIERFVLENKEALGQIESAFFSVNLVARKDDKNRADTNPYLIKFLESTNWKPDKVDVFAGKLDYSLYPFFDRWMVKLIMKFTKGPTSTPKAIEYTDWDRVRKFAEEFYPAP